MHSGDRRLGALDLYREAPGSLDEATMAAAQTLADVAAAYLHNAQTRADLQDSSERSREAALHDPLTGLPNRVLMLERLQHAFLRAQRSGKTLAVLFVDLDAFKAVNDTFGHGIGDELLMVVADRLSQLLRPGDTLARLSGDEFVVLCEDLDSADQAIQIAGRLDARLTRPFILSNAQVDVTASVGIAFADRGDHIAGRADEASERLLHDADTAMYQAKRRGGGRHQTLDLGAQHLADRQAGLQHDLHGAIRRGEFYTEYQPIVATADRHIVGVEALIRWALPVHSTTTT